MKVSKSQLINVLKSTSANEITLILNSPVKLKKRGNPLADKAVTKHSEGSYQFGSSYETAVNEALVADGSTNTFTAKSLPWGAWVEGCENKVIQNTKKDGTTEYYVRYYNATSSVSVEYLIEGAKATASEVDTIKEFSYDKSGSKTQEGVGLSEEKQIKVHVAAFSNIQSIEIDGTTYEVE